MGQYYLLVNTTRHQQSHVGSFYGEWDIYLRLFGWEKTDNVTAYGDYGNVMHMNCEAPEDVQALDEEGVWKMCVFAAKKLGISPHDFYCEFMADDEDDVEMTTIDYYDLAREFVKKMDQEPRLDKTEIIAIQEKRLAKECDEL